MDTNFSVNSDRFRPIPIDSGVGIPRKGRQMPPARTMPFRRHVNKEIVLGYVPTDRSCGANVEKVVSNVNAKICIDL